MTKKIRDDAIFISGMPPEVELQQIEDTFNTADIIKVRLFSSACVSYLVY